MFRMTPYKDFEPIAVAVTNPLLVIINPSVQAQTVKDLIALIKANPGKYNYATGGTGSAAHLVGEQLRLSLGLDLVHIPYNSAGLAIGSVVAGHAPIYIGSPAPALPQIEEGKLRALAVTSKTRWKTLPDVPTMAEIGYTDIEGENWQAVLVPAGTPKEITLCSIRRSSKLSCCLTSRSAWLSSASSRLPIRPVRVLSKSGRKLPNGQKLSERPTSRRSKTTRAPIPQSSAPRMSEARHRRRGD